MFEKYHDMMMQNLLLMVLGASTVGMLAYYATSRHADRPEIITKNINHNPLPEKYYLINNGKTIDTVFVEIDGKKVNYLLNNR